MVSKEYRAFSEVSGALWVATELLGHEPSCQARTITLGNGRKLKTGLKCNCALADFKRHASELRLIMSNWRNGGK